MGEEFSVCWPSDFENPSGKNDSPLRVRPVCTLWILLLLPLIPWMGCLATDPDSQITLKRVRKTLASEIVEPTSAPKNIDKQMLSSRAFGEAPQLAQRVKNGELPPATLRLPENPLVVVPLEEIGRYGGIIRRGLTGDIAQWPGVAKCMAENLLAFKRPMGDGIEANLVTHYDFQDGGRTALLSFRKGIRWSDGHPFTVDDVIFYYNDMLFNENARSSDIPRHPLHGLLRATPLNLRK